MRLGPIEPSDVPAGRVILWVPETVTPEVDERLPSPDQMQRASSYLASASQGENPWIGWKVLLRDATPQTVARALEHYVATHESLRTGFTAEGGAVMRHLVRTSPRWTWSVLAEQADAQDAHHLITEHARENVRALGWPNFAFVGVESADRCGEIVLVGAFDHIIYDGMSAYSALHDLPALHRALVNGDSARVASLSHVDHAHAQTTTTLSVTDDVLDAWRGILRDGDIAPLPSAAGVGRGERLPQETSHFHLAGPRATQLYRRSMRDAGVKEGAAFCGLLLWAIAEHGDAEVDFLMSLHGRPSMEWFDAVGWFASLAPVSLDLRGADGLIDACRLLQSAAATGAVHPPLTVVARELGLALEPSLVVSYMTAEAFTGFGEWGRDQAKPIIATTPPSSQMHVWLSAQHDGLSLDVRYPKNERSAAWLRDVAATMRGALADHISSAQAGVRGELS